MDAAFLHPDYADWNVAFTGPVNNISDANWREAEAVFAECRASLERHFAMEEKILFLAYENAIGKSEGPTSIMRREHHQIRSVLAMLNEALDKCDANDFVRHSEALDAMLRQHYIKKESIRYLMADETFSAERNTVLDKDR